MANFSVIFIAMSFVVLVNSLMAAEPEINVIFPKECEGESFCDVEPQNYPYNYFNKYVTDMQKKNFMSRVLEEDTPSQVVINDDENCSTLTSVIYPFMVQSNTTTRLVVQSKYFKQKVIQTQCRNDGATCFKSLEGLGYTSSCVEQYGEIQLYLYDPIERQIKHDTVRVPVCCRCNTQRNSRK